MELLAKYQNGNLTTELWEDGTRVRCTEDDEFYPAFAENVDIHISNRCDHGCPMCYANCTKDGMHGKLEGWNFLDTLHPGTEMALNLNFPIHPDIKKFLEYLRSRDIITNITVNQDHFMLHEDVIKDFYNKKLIFGLGISLTNPTKEFINKVKEYPNAVIHVINGLVTANQIHMMAHNGLKVLILGYKDIGRGVDYHKASDEHISNNQKWLRENLDSVCKMFNVTSFDNLALDQLNVKHLLTDEQWKVFYGGDDGTFTFFINLVDGYFAKNSLSEVRYPIGNKTMDEMFQVILEEKERQNGRTD